MKFAHCTDSHENPLADKVIEQINLEKPDMVIHSGDFQGFWADELSQPEIILKSQEYVKNFIAKFDAPVIFTVGNHDALEHAGEGFLKTKKHLYDNVYAIGVPGTVSTNLGGDEFWSGYPFGPEFDNKEFLEFTSKVPVSSDEFLKTKVPKCPEFGKQQYNAIASQIQPGEKYIIVTHQGPFYSQTSSDTFHDKFFSSGSPGVQAAIEEFSEQIIFVVHGHTHAARQQQFEIQGVPVCNPGCALNGFWAVYDIEGEIIKSIEMKKVEQ